MCYFFALSCTELDLKHSVLPENQLFRRLIKYEKQIWIQRQDEETERETFCFCLQAFVGLMALTTYFTVAPLVNIPGPY